MHRVPGRMRGNDRDLPSEVPRHSNEKFHDIEFQGNKKASPSKKKSSLFLVPKMGTLCLILIAIIFFLFVYLLPGSTLDLADEAGRGSPLSDSHSLSKHSLESKHLLSLHHFKHGMRHHPIDLHAPHVSNEDIVIDTKHSVHHYTVCNGLSNQLLAHAGNIAFAITHGIPVMIPDAFILNGAQNAKSAKSGVLLDATPSNSKHTRLSEIFDVDELISTVKSFGIDATLVPYSDTVHGDLLCSWIDTLRMSQPGITRNVLKAFLPSKSMALLADVVKDHLNDDDAVCVHHRDGDDWKNHCSVWENIPDGVWRKNCMHQKGHNLSGDIINRLLDRGDRKLPSIFYVGDHLPPPDLALSGFDVMTRGNVLWEVSKSLKDFDHRGPKPILQPNPTSLRAQPKALTLDTLRGVLAQRDVPCPADFRDVCAAVDFLICSGLNNFVGNSVSTWSALQILQRNGAATWYNSRSIPLAMPFNDFPIPIVYTYTESSAATGKIMLMTSILSARLYLSSTEIHVLYHGFDDVEFKLWLQRHSVIVHQHEPAWIGLIEEMFRNGDVKKSHLFQHLGNYIGTWQRVDIPLYINAEFVLLVDCDTVVTASFSYADFTNEMTGSIAFSAEMDEHSEEPWNAGVALLNVPYLRETYDDFLAFIATHRDNHPYKIKMGNGKTTEAPSDQGAYLEFYATSKVFLSKKFNDKPYYEDTDSGSRETKILHFHGAKPHDYLGHWLGIECNPAVKFLCEKGNDLPKLCPSLRSFSVAILSDEVAGDSLLQTYCQQAFSKMPLLYAKECANFFKALDALEDRTATGMRCEDLLLRSIANGWANIEQ